MKHTIRKIIAENEGVLRNKFKVQNLALYGSIVTGNYNENSDIDFVVSFHSPVGSKYVELTIFLNSILPLKIDLITREGTRKVFYNQISAGLEFLIYD